VEQHGTAASGTACPAAPPGPTDAAIPPDPNNAWRRRLFAYDSLSRLRWASNPESGIISYSYDNDSNLLQKTSPAPNQTGSATQTISYCYDELHRITGKAYGALNCPLTSPVVSYAYDSGANAKGHLTQMTDQAGTASYAFDVLGRLTTETRTLTGANNAAISKTLSYEYNLDGSLSKLHYPSSAVVAYTPDSAGRITQAVDGVNGINYVTGASYGPDSSLTGFVNSSGGAAPITNTFTYNKRLQPVTMSAATSSQTVFSIGYDFHAGNGTAGSGSNNGNVFAITNYKDSNRNQTFTYDALNRLLTAQNAGTNCAAMTVNGKTEYWGNSYTYDAWGNLLGKTVTKCGAENLGVTADAHNWLHHSPTDYQYDAAGNMTFDATENVSLSYDLENRITGAAGYTYTYDGDGNRVRKSNGNLAANGTLYWYMTPGVVAETDLAGTTKSEYIFFEGERVARRDGVNGTGGVFYYFSDHLKTASVITDASGTIKADSDYYPWGGELQFVNNDSNHYKFTSKERDGESGLDYFGARYYSSGLGRWVSADWSATPVPVPYADFGDPQTLNQYSYVRNAPTVKIDADGHCPDGGCLVPPKTLAELDKMNQDNKDIGVGLAKGTYNTFASAENTFLSMGESSSSPIPLMEPSNEVQEVAMTAGTIVTTVLSVLFAHEPGGKAPARDPEPEPYNRSQHYGNPSSSAAAKGIRANGEGQPCPTCGKTMKSGTATAPTAEHQPTLKQHYYQKGGKKMTPAERRAYARSSSSMQKEAVCKPCQSKQGAAEARKKY
jgi:RHS repeat-associated protein